MLCTLCRQSLRQTVGGYLEFGDGCCSVECARAWAIVQVLERLLDVIERRESPLD